MNRQKWLILVLGAAEDYRLSPVQLQKTLFLLSKRIPDHVGQGFYEFIPYDYGPFCRDIYDDAEILEGRGLLRIEKTSGRRWREYSLSKPGRIQARELKEELPAEIKDYLKKLVPWVQGLSFDGLVRTIYREFPKFKANSVFCE